MTIHWKAIEHYLAVVLFIFQLYSVFNFGKFISFGLVSVRSERVKITEDKDSTVLPLLHIYNWPDLNNIIFTAACRQSQAVRNFIVSLTAIFRLITQCSSSAKQTLKMAAKETNDSKAIVIVILLIEQHG